MKYRILKEVRANEGESFKPTGDFFECDDNDQAQAHVFALQDEHGGCFAIEAVEEE